MKVVEQHALSLPTEFNRASDSGSAGEFSFHDVGNVFQQFVPIGRVPKAGDTDLFFNWSPGGGIPGYEQVCGTFGGMGEIDQP
jgi:hypothetical protein